MAPKVGAKADVPYIVEIVPSRATTSFAPWLRHPGSLCLSRGVVLGFSTVGLAITHAIIRRGCLVRGQGEKVLNPQPE